jgi:hypothetical protein
MPGNFEDTSRVASSFVLAASEVSYQTPSGKTGCYMLRHLQIRAVSFIRQVRFMQMTLPGALCDAACSKWEKAATDAEKI